MKTIDELTPLGAHIRKYRRAERYSLEGLAKIAGITKSRMWEIEAGAARNLRLDTMIGLAKATGTTLARITTLAAAGYLDKRTEVEGA